MARGWGHRPALALAFALALAAPAAWAQVALDSPFLIINQERLLTGSRAGQEILAEEERQRDTLRSEARALDASFEAEERMWKSASTGPMLPSVSSRPQSEPTSAKAPP